MNKPTVLKREGFWRHQFSTAVTPGQIIFDVVVGAIIPILLLIFDPVVFRNGELCQASALQGDGLFAYLAIGLGILALFGWLFIDTLKHNGTAFIAGILLTGALFAAGVGIAILPLSVFGLLALVGAFGFLPFFTAFVYFRNGVRAFRTAEAAPGRRVRRFASLIAGAVIVLGLPLMAQTQITNLAQNEIDTIVNNQDALSQTGISELRTVNQVCLGLCTSTIAAVFSGAVLTHHDQRAQLETTFTQITGQVLLSFDCNNGE